MGRSIHVYVCHVCAVHMCVEARGQHLLSSSITLFPAFSERPLTEPGSQGFGETGCEPQGSSCLCAPSAGITLMHHHTQLYTQVLGIQIQVLRFAWHTLYQLSCFQVSLVYLALIFESGSSYVAQPGRKLVCLPGAEITGLGTIRTIYRVQ